MLRAVWKLEKLEAARWLAAALSAVLLELPFPLAGPLPAWRAIFAWVALVPLLWALLTPKDTDRPHPLRRGFLLGYLCGVLWYAGNCYWVRDTMQHYGGLPTGVPSLLLVAFSLYLGLYFGLFGLGVALLRRATGSTRMTLAASPFLWVAMELAAAHISGFPWDQLGDSQVENMLLTQLAPWTGVYGISFVLAAFNAVLACVLLRCWPGWALSGLAAVFLLLNAPAHSLPAFLQPPPPAPTATAMLIQPNLDVAAENNWNGPEWNRRIARFAQWGGAPCGSYIAGVPQTGAPENEIPCPTGLAHPDLVAWPESPAPFFEAEPRLQQALKTVAGKTQSPLVVGIIGMDFSAEEGRWHSYNSALVTGADGARVGRYDKIHLVPFGEYIPFKRLLFFARTLTGQVSEFARGDGRKLFRLKGHRYGVFICYESVFAVEVRQFAQLGAEVLVNISDDGWYGDTSAPWQHLNMARMRAIENRRWILRDTNNGVTAVIDPYGRVRQSIPRHQSGALAARFGFCNEITFYTAHGDVFAWVCALLTLGMVGWAARKSLRQYLKRSKLHKMAQAAGMQPTPPTAASSRAPAVQPERL